MLAYHEKSEEVSIGGYTALMNRCACDVGWWWILILYLIFMSGHGYSYLT